ncbi:MAG: imidazoleglycerol-phosphate dehydratase HisB [Spirochaetia bacterium]
MRSTTIERKTKETSISLSLDLDSRSEATVNLGIPFFEHLLTSMAFHGGFGIIINGEGDLDVDPHHLVEDTGLVLGEALRRILEAGPVARYGHAVIPMDEALSEAVIDASGRPFLVYRAEFPQNFSGTFDLSLIREFFHGVSQKGTLTIHALCRYGTSSHHMAEALFKAFGIAVGKSFLPRNDTKVRSTKGTIL